MYNPTRRNKNIGKTQGGRVKNGKANEKWSRIFSRNVWWELSEENSSKKKLIEENPSKNFIHPCTVNEYKQVLDQLPKDETEYINAIILTRKSKRDQKLGIDARRRCSCVIINAVPKSLEYIWKSKPSESTINHYKHWCNNWIRDNEKFILKWTLEEIRKYLLYHVFLHEVGHINQPAFHSLKRREEFAENYALEWAKKLKII